MTQKALHLAQAGAAVQHVGCKRMAQRVRRDPILKTELLGVTFDNQPQSLAREPFPRGFRKSVRSALFAPSSRLRPLSR